MQVGLNWLWSPAFFCSTSTGNGSDNYHIDVDLYYPGKEIR